MITLNARIDADAYEHQSGESSKVAARFGVDDPLTLSVARSRTGHFQVEFKAESESSQLDRRYLSFEATTTSMLIRFWDWPDTEQIKAAFLAAAQTIQMYQEEQVPESIAVMLAGLPNKKQHEGIFDEAGEPRTHESLFDLGGQLIHPNLPTARPLNSSNKGHMKMYREFNHLRIVNLNEFLTEYSNNLDYYESPFQILADLEAKVKYQDLPDAEVFVSYKEDGVVLFRKSELYQDGGRRVVEYEYFSSIS